ncbi:MAG: hypothetical protein J6M30_06305 [Bacteroidales bacterium]|nr:hypothetical protein [Bacteroidales bacterium]
MAIYGAGSKIGDPQVEKKEEFFKKSAYWIGWGYADAEDLYSALSSVKVGDIIYLKSNQPGSRTITVKGIGIVTGSVIQNLFENKTANTASQNRNLLKINVAWVYKDEFKITIHPDDGKLTNIRAATFYEEFLPQVQTEIINKVLGKVKP